MTTLERPLRPMRASGNSANLYYYGEGGREERGRVWVEVLADTVTRNGLGEIVARSRPIYHIRIYRTGYGMVATTTYTPRRKPNPLALSPRLVARLVREALGGAPS